MQRDVFIGFLSCEFYARVSELIVCESDLNEGLWMIVVCNRQAMFFDIHTWQMFEIHQSCLSAFFKSDTRICESNTYKTTRYPLI